MSLPVIAFFDIPYHSRLMTTLPLVRALVAKGHPVYVFTLKPYQALVTSVGAQCVLQPEFGPEPPLCTVNLRTIDYAMTAVPALVDSLRRLRPAIVMHTAKCLWAAIAAEVCGIPAVGLHTNVLMPRGVPVSDEVFASRWPGMDEQTLKGLEARDAQAWQLCANKFGISQINAWDVLPGMPNCMNLRGALNLVYCSERLQPHRECFGEEYHFVGACYEPRAEDADPVFEAQLEHLPRPLLYASLGSMALYNDRIHIFEQILNACSAGQRGIVMSVGTEDLQARIQPLPSHVLVHPYVPQLTVLEKASLFVTHAGSNSVYESLLAGVPMLMLPQGGDQPILAEHVSSLGLGIWLRSEALATDALSVALDRVLNDPDFYTRARVAGEELRQAGGLSRATELVSHFAQGTVGECR